MLIAIATYPGFTALDAIGPYQVFAHLPGAEVVVCAANRGELDDDHGALHLRIDQTFDEIDTPDVLVVAGGLSTRQLVRDGHPIIDWIRAVHPHTSYTTSVCTGALLLGAAGILDGTRATTHWTAHDRLREFGAHPVAERVVHDGKIVTAAGVSAGIDLALTLVAQIAGPDIARAIQLGIEYDPHPPFDSGTPATAPADIVDIVRAVTADAEQRFLDDADTSMSHTADTSTHLHDSRSTSCAN
ncbi:MAG: DJ-1/PfpI family protein [Ilumatobacteraceae bacterium]|jgi:transcriptional regulator GlxA family with amidase domain